MGVCVKSLMDLISFRKMTTGIHQEEHVYQEILTFINYNPSKDN